MVHFNCLCSSHLKTALKIRNPTFFFLNQAPETCTCLSAPGEDAGMSLAFLLVFSISSVFYSWWFTWYGWTSELVFTSGSWSYLCDTVLRYFESLINAKHRLFIKDRYTHTPSFLQTAFEVSMNVYCQWIPFIKWLKETVIVVSVK